MDTLRSFDAVRVLDDVYALPSYLPIPKLGVLAMNAYLVRGQEPMLIDAGPGPISNDLVASLASLVDLEDLRWLWLTHTDPDHIGAVEDVLERAPKARVVTTFLGAGKMALHRPLPEDRTHLIQPGETLRIGDREILAARPPVFDAPETIAAFDTKSRALFSADCFGALLSEPAESAADIPAEALREGLIGWAGIDTPWLEHVNPDRLKQAVNQLRELDPSVVLSGHLPPAFDMLDGLADHLLAAIPSANADGGAVAMSSSAHDATSHPGSGTTSRPGSGTTSRPGSGTTSSSASSEADPTRTPASKPLDRNASQAIDSVFRDS